MRFDLLKNSIYKLFLQRCITTRRALFSFREGEKKKVYKSFHFVLAKLRFTVPCDKADEIENKRSEQESSRISS